jgi:hypothetical protein
MILRRVIEHVRAQNWFAVGLDFGIVVIGVFVGIQVSNWNQERVGAEQQQRYLERLESDFTSIQERIDEHFATFEQVIGGADYILELLRMPEEDFRSVEIDEQRLDDALSYLTQTRIRNDPQFEVAVMILGTNARNNYGVRRAQGGLTDEVLGLLKARDRS